MGIIALYLSVIFASGLLFVNINTSVVDARSWGSDIPASIESARQYSKKYSPGTFFQIFGPVNLLLALGSLILCWPAEFVRWYLMAALFFFVASDVFTVLYFFPRNDIMFRTGSISDVKALTDAWSQWSRMNWLRSFILLIGLLCSVHSLHLLLGR